MEEEAEITEFDANGKTAVGVIDKKNLEDEELRKIREEAIQSISKILRSCPTGNTGKTNVKVSKEVSANGNYVSEIGRTEIVHLPRELSSQNKEIVELIWDRNKPITEVITSAFGADITRKDMLTLYGSEWLNDEVINFFLKLLVKRSEKNSTLPKVYAFNTFFYEKLCQTSYTDVKRWTRKVDIFSYQILLIPIHLGNHWCMATEQTHQRISITLQELAGFYDCGSTCKEAYLEIKLHRDKTAAGPRICCADQLPYTFTTEENDTDVQLILRRTRHSQNFKLVYDTRMSFLNGIYRILPVNGTASIRLECCEKDGNRFWIVKNDDDNELIRVDDVKCGQVTH